MKKPVIGITPAVADERAGVYLSMAYLYAVENAGGIPLVLPHTKNAEVAQYYAKLCDGFIFSGGPDVDPARYGEAPWYALGSVSQLQDCSDFTYFEPFYESGKPLFGICRGCQALNVMMGGTLYQDISSQFPYAEDGLRLTHGQAEKGWIKTHEVTAKEDSLIREVYGSERFKVNSFHHQAVKLPAPGMVVTAHAADGVIEALESADDRFIVLTQWHPEMLYPQCEKSRELFRRFVEACG